MYMNNNIAEIVVDIQLMNLSQLLNLPLTTENLFIGNIIYFRNIVVLKKFLEKPLNAYWENNSDCFFTINYEMKEKYPIMILPSLELKEKIDQDIVVDEDFTLYKYYVICGSENKS